VFADLPYTWAEFEQGVARLFREGQKRMVNVQVLQSSLSVLAPDGSRISTVDERLWRLISGKRYLSDIAIDGQYEVADSANKVQRALRRWLDQVRTIGSEPTLIQRRRDSMSDAQAWRAELGRLRSLPAEKCDDVFADPGYTERYLEHLVSSQASALSRSWLKSKLKTLVRPHMLLVDMGCGLNPLSDLPCKVLGLDRHDHPGVLRGKMEDPPLDDRSADFLVYSLSLYGTATDLVKYFSHARRILRPGGGMVIVEPESSFSEPGLKRFVHGLGQYGFVLPEGPKRLRTPDGTTLLGMHFVLSGDKGRPQEYMFERK
jgi:SAM-dependent methyltransferase